MKKLVFTWALMLISLSAVTAQTEKGRWTVGAQVGNLSYSTQYNGRSFSGSFTPSAGYFIANNLAVGTGVPVSFATGSSDVRDYRTQNSSLGLSPFVSYYFGKASLKPYAGVSYTYAKTSLRSDLNDGANSQHYAYRGFSSNVSPSVGLAYFINQTVALQTGISFVRSWENLGNTQYNVVGDPVKSSTYTLDYFTLSAGFRLFFGK